MTRRDVLKAAAVGSVALGVAGRSPAADAFVASPELRDAALKPRRGGTLRVAATGGSSADTINFLSPLTVPDYARSVNLYEPLVTMNAAGAPQLALAEEITPNSNASVWTIRLRKGLTFHNGKPLTAADVIFTFKTFLNPKHPGESASSFQSIDTAGLKALDKYTVRVPCTKPFSTFVECLSVIGFSEIIPVGYDPRHPVGAGPFKLASFTPGVASTFTRFGDYWQSGLPYLDKLVIEDYADETSQVNAILGGQADAATLVPAPSISGITSAGQNVCVSPGGGWNPLVMRVDTPPFSDPRVRQALKLIVDRPQMINVAFDGHGTIGNDIPGIWAPEYDKAIPQRHQDIQQAKSLLKAAGHSKLQLQLVVPVGLNQGIQASAQVFAQQAQAAGVSVSLREITVGAYYNNLLKWPFTMDFWYNDLYFPSVALNMLPSSPYNETHFNNASYTKLYSQALAVVDPVKRADIAHEMQQIEYSQSGYIIPYFAPTIDAYASKVRGVVPSKTGASFNGYDFKRMWLS